VGELGKSRYLFLEGMAVKKKAEGWGGGRGIFKKRQHVISLVGNRNGKF